MRSVIGGRRTRWLLGAVLVSAGTLLQQSSVYAQDAEGTTQVVEASSGFIEQAAPIITNPAVAAVLIAAGVLLLLADLFTAGFGLAGMLGIGLLAVFFWGHYHAGLAGWESIALVALGVVLLALEVFVIPGFGIAGIAGLAALLGGLFLSMIGDENVSREAMVRAGSTVSVAVITTVAGGVALLWLLPQLPWLRGLVLQTQVPIPESAGGRDSLILGAALDRDGADGWSRGVAPEPRSLLGATGVALSDLRPSGFAWIGGTRVDVVSRGEFIPAGAPIEMIADEGYRRVVRRVEEHDTGTRDADVSGVR